MTQYLLFLLAGILAGAGGTAWGQSMPLQGQAIYRMVEVRSIRKLKETFREWGMLDLTGWQQGMHHLYALDFSPQRAYYHPYKHLTPQTKSRRPQRIIVMSNAGKTEVFTDLLRRQWVKIIDKEELYYIADSLIQINWQLLPERRQVGQFLTFKARGRVVDVQCPPDDSGLCKIDTVEVVAWYTPQIPVTFGPDIYGGLPGLILELKDNRNHYYLQKVILEPRTEEIPQPPSANQHMIQMSWEEWLRHRRDQYNKNRQK